MKKLVLFAAIALSLSFVSCQKSPADYKKEIDGLEKEYTELVKEGKTEEAKKVQEKALKLIGEIAERADKDPDFAKELKDFK